MSRTCRHISESVQLRRRRPLAFIWVEGLLALVTAYADSVEEGRAAAERLAESRR
jgi:hypothetical protein